jgi:hypothetical protein
MRTISFDGKSYMCETKEQFLDAQIKALIHVKDDGLATGIKIKLLQEIMQDADKLYGETKHNIVEK